METSTINQLIATSGILMLGFGGMIFYWKAVKAKSDIKREVTLLKDCIFFRELLEKYKSEKGKNNKINVYRKEVFSKIGYYPSELSEPARIKSRLEILSTHDIQIQEFLSKISIN